MHAAPETIGARALAFLARPDSYPDGPDSVTLIETHFAWVFLSRRFVYKLKKPLRFRALDLTTLAARRANCELEVALNRRLADGVYIGVVPLGARGEGFALESSIDPVEWLVKMRRLPAERMLDRAARENTVRDEHTTRLVDRLCSYYERAARAPWTGAEYRGALAERIAQYGAELGALALPAEAGARLRALTAAQRRFVVERAALLDERIAAGRVVDAHGDLRPEHVFLGDEVQIIDCLEFSAELRLLDTAEELAFLALELERLGCTALGARILRLYSRRGADPAPPELLAFYRSVRALVRALLAALHVVDAPAAAREHWHARAAWYLDAALAAFAAHPIVPARG
jgi:aminoglycoside phosphotransferase family enzyme